MRILDGIRDLLNQKSAVQMVADDPQMAAELLLLLRTMFADGEMSPEEVRMFKTFCSTLFNLTEDDVPEVIRFLRDFGYETSGEQAASVFADVSAERRQQLMVHIVAMAQADNVIHDKEAEMIRKVAAVLGYTPEQVESFL